MKTKLRKITSVCLAVIMILGVLTIAPITASAANNAQDYVSDAKTVNYQYTDSEYGEQVDVTYRLPKITLGSSDAETVNDEILQTYSEFFEHADELEDIKNNYLKYTELDYDSYLNNNILSVVIHYEYGMNSLIDYSVYNFDTTTGNLISNQQLADKLSLDYDLIKEQITNEITKKFENIKENISSTDYENNLKKSINQDNINDSRLYLSSDGQMMAIYRIYWVAGAGLYYWLMEIDITAEPTTAEPTTAESTEAEPTTAEPTTAEPTEAEPTTSEIAQTTAVSAVNSTVSNQSTSDTAVTTSNSNSDSGTIQTGESIFAIIIAVIMIAGIAAVYLINYSKKKF